MPEIGLFPLSVVLLPTERVPLHIFETRYKELINTCLAQDAPFGMVLVAAEQTHEIGTYAQVVQVLELFDDGRLNLIVEGGGRFKILRTHAVRAYFTADIVEYTDDAPPPPGEVREAFLEEYRRAAEQVGMDPPEIGLDGDLSFRIAAQLSLGLDDKQDLLQMRAEADRLNRLRDLLPKAVLDARKSLVRERAATNGHLRRILDR